MKRGQMVGVIVMLLTVTAVGVFVLEAVSERSYSGNWGTSAGRGFDVYNIPLDPARGSYVRFEVASTDDRTVDVYLTDQDGLRAARSGDPFEFDVQHSAVNTVHVSQDLRISEYSQVVVMSHDPRLEVRVTSSAEQSAYPLDVLPVLRIAGLACLAMNVILVAMLVQAWVRTRRSRAGRN